VLGIRQRDLYSTTATYMSYATSKNGASALLEQQTGVVWATLKRHNGKWLTAEGASGLLKIGPRIGPNSCGEF
jgi:hypothetical protein